MSDFQLHVVLVEPEIPQNTGSIGRLCLATGSTLHLIEPLGFEISHSRLRRAGLDYWEHLSVQTHSSFESYLDKYPDASTCRYYLSKNSGPTLYDCKLRKGTHMVFGKETAGLAPWILEKYASDTVRIPMFDARVRSLNLATAVGICIYEGVRQIARLES